MDVLNQMSLSLSSQGVSFLAPPLLPSSDMTRLDAPTDQLYEAIVAIARAALPAFTNAFFTGDRLSNSGVALTEQADILRVVQSQTALIVYLTSEWQQYLLDVNAPVDVDAISKTIDGVFEAAIQLGPKAIDLRDINLAQVNGEHLAAVLRATFAFRERTPGWQHALGVARLALEHAGLDSEDALYGLL